MKKTLLVEMFTALLVLLFVYASISKIVNLEEYIRSMHNQPFPSWFANLLIWTLPLLEVIISLALIYTKTRRIGLYGFATLMALFTLYIAAIIFHLFPRIPCSCGELIQSLSWTQHLFFNLFFIVVALIGIKLNKDISLAMPPSN